MPKRKGKRRAWGEGGLFEYERKRKRRNGEEYTEKGWQGAVTLGYDENGKQRRKFVYAKTQTEARQKLDALRRQLTDGTLSDTDPTVKSYLKVQWLPAKKREVKIQTVEDYEYQLDKYVIPRIGKHKLSSLKPLHVQAMCNELADEVSPQRANKARRVLSTALRQAVRWQVIPRNPCDAVKPMKVDKADITIWTPEEATRFLAEAQAHRLYAAFYLAMSTGMRRGELLGLRWKDVDGHDLYVRQNLIEQRGKIMFSTTKTAKGYRRIDISEDVVEVLAAHKQRQDGERQEARLLWADSGLVFTTEIGTPYHPRNLERAWYALQDATRDKWRKEAEERKDEATMKALDEGRLMPHARLHDLRHLHASVLILVEKRSALEVAERLGHTNPSFTMDVYAHFFEQQRQSNPVSIRSYLSLT